jgi:uncharacterized membrane protein YkgB
MPGEIVDNAIAIPAAADGPPRVLPAAVRKFQALEVWAIGELRRISLPLLRWAVGIVFIWFGALKLVGSTPVADFVAHTLPWFNRAWLIPALGLFEVAIGVAMIVGRFLTVVCAVMVAHLAGTFLSLVMQPEVTFQHGNPLMLTAEGEFVIKNLVLIAAGLVIAARFTRPRRAGIPASRRPAEE